jgi:hypothetical protein
MPGYNKKEYYAPVQTEKVNTLDQRFLGLTNVQIGLFTIPTILVIASLVLLLLNKKARYSPAIYISLFISSAHLYHHYTLARLQNKYVK